MRIQLFGSCTVTLYFPGRARDDKCPVNKQRDDVMANAALMSVMLLRGISSTVHAWCDIVTY